ncbi:MAG TPA: hypothetical protein DCQ30_00160 [Acidimicrobiaceae bacterium]|nr:hypothetical protein [Acidimicrobiaceae bacterium]
MRMGPLRVSWALGAAAGMAALLVAPATPVAMTASSTPVGPVTVQVGTTHPGPVVNEGLIGTNQPVTGAGETAAAGAMSALGVGWARTDMSLDAAYDCATGGWDPTALDQRVASDRAMGGQPELIVDYSPPCMTTLGRTLEPPDAGNYGPWSGLVEEAAYHEITTQGVRLFEVWNEPDGTFWYGTLADYLSTYRATVLAIDRAARAAGVDDVLVGGPALLFPDPAWLGPFLTYVTANQLPLGFVSWHYYGDYPGLGPFAEGAATVPPELPAVGPYWYNPMTRAQTYGYQVQFVQQLLAGYPALHPLTVIDEWNLDAGYDVRSDTAYDAAFAAAVLDSVQAAGLNRMAFFRVADDQPGTLGNWGMLFANDTPKPVYSTFLFWHEMAGRLLPASLSPDQTGADPLGRVGAVASLASDGTIRVLLYDYAPYDPTGAYGTTDPNPYDHPVTVTLGGLTPGVHSYSLAVVDGTGTKTTSGTTTGTVSTGLSGESVALLTVS